MVATKTKKKKTSENNRKKKTFEAVDVCESMTSWFGARVQSFATHNDANILHEIERKNVYRLFHLFGFVDDYYYYSFYTLSTRTVAQRTYTHTHTH